MKLYNIAEDERMHEENHPPIEGEDEDDEDKEFPPLTKEKKQEAKKFETQLSNYYFQLKNYRNNEV
jgi:broad specificity phosphatase PhoE